jgi:ketosteroid isomerase-like protein
MKNDLDRIEELHQTDMRASKTGDFATLRSLMSGDAAVMPPGGRLIRGGEALDRSFAAMRAAESHADVLEYRFDWQEVRVLGEYAFEWGYIHGQERDRETGDVRVERYHVMRILQRQPDGSWKVHRTIWNEAAAPAQRL